jgi:hypothetical protein
MKTYKLCAGKGGGDVMVSYKEVIGCTEGYAWYVRRPNSAWIHALAGEFQHSPPPDYESFRALVKLYGGVKGEVRLRCACSGMLRSCTDATRTPAPLTAQMGFSSPKSWGVQVGFLVSLFQRYETPEPLILEIEWRALAFGGENLLV